MKRVNTLVLLFFNLSFSLAQQQMGITFQGVAYDAEQRQVTNRKISVRTSVIQDNQPIYVETHLTSTNNVGLFSLIIGNGVPSLGQYATIPWKAGSLRLRREYDLEGGTNYIISGEDYFYAIPYALYAQEAAPAPIIDINGTSYSTKIIDTLEWMLNNLSVTHYNDGTPISDQDIYHYNNDATLIAQYGRQYSFSAVSNDLLCPVGWRVPTKEEWENLLSTIDGPELKIATTAWNGYANNRSMFSAKPGGLSDGAGNHSGITLLGYYWTSTAANGNTAYSIGFFPGSPNPQLENSYEQSFTLSVRCVR